MRCSIDICDLSSHEEHIDLVLDWLRSEWDDSSDPFSLTITPAPDRPGARLAMLSGTPVGVVAFKRHDLSPTSANKLWVNALFVTHQHRRFGVAERMLLWAMDDVIPSFADELYAFTRIPSLSGRVGWTHIDYNSHFDSHTFFYS
ncbi:MAG: GNAT family N-acetyltransferase [Planctomycetota bacterium]